MPDLRTKKSCEGEEGSGQWEKWEKGIRPESSIHVYLCAWIFMYEESDVSMDKTIVRNERGTKDLNPDTRCSRTQLIVSIYTCT